MPTQLTNLLLPLFAIIVALLAAAGLWLWWSNSQDSRAATGSPPEQRRETPPTPAPPASISAPAAAPVEPGMVEVMRVLRDLADGSLIVEIDGRRYYALKEITDPQVGRRFLGNAQAVAQFAHLGDIKVPPEPLPPTPSPPLATSTPSPTASTPSPTAPPPSPAAPPAQPTPLFEQPPSPAPSKAKAAPPASPPKRGGLFGGKPAATSDEEEQGYVEPPSIAEQIEEMLQVRLPQHPEFKGRNIHIFPTLDGGLRIYVDAESYDSVGDVSDPAVREFLQGIIREWEAAQ